MSGTKGVVHHAARPSLDNMSDPRDSFEVFLDRQIRRVQHTLRRVDQRITRVHRQRLMAAIAADEE